MEFCSPHGRISYACVLDQSELFRDLPRAALDEIRTAGIPRHVLQHDIVFHQGDAAATLYIVLDGRLRATQSTPDGGQVIFRYLGPGELAGYAVLTGEDQHPSTVTAVTEARLLALSRTFMRQIITRYPQTAVNALAVIGRRHLEMQQRLQEFSTQGVEQRIARAVLRLARQAGRRTARGIEIAFPVLRQDLAEMTGANLHTVSRTVSAWESSGLVGSGRRRIIVYDVRKLALIAGEAEEEG